MSKDFTARVMTWAQKIRAAGDADIANLLLSAEMGKRKKPRAPRAKRVNVAKHGTRVRGGAAFVNLDNPDIRIVENQTGKLGW